MQINNFNRASVSTNQNNKPAFGSIKFKFSDGRVDEFLEATGNLPKIFTREWGSDGFSQNGPQEYYLIKGPDEKSEKTLFEILKTKFKLELIPFKTDVDELKDKIQHAFPAHVSEKGDKIDFPGK